MTDELVEKVAREIAAGDGLDFDEICGIDADPDEGACDSGTCVAATWEEHDPEQARRYYIHLARAVIPLIYNAAIEDAAAVMGGFGSDLTADLIRALAKP